MIYGHDHAANQSVSKPRQMLLTDRPTVIVGATLIGGIMALIILNIVGTSIFEFSGRG